MAGTSDGAKKRVSKVREAYGEDAFKEWGAKGAQMCENRALPFKEDPQLASDAGSKGGALGHRHRTITAEDSMKPDEWAVLLKFINRAAGKVRIEYGSIDAIEQHNIYHRIFEFWESEDWVGAVTEATDDKVFPLVLRQVIEEEYDYYSHKVQGQPRRSSDRERLRIIRNVKAAVQSLGDYNNANRKDNS